MSSVIAVQIKAIVKLKDEIVYAGGDDLKKWNIKVSQLCKKTTSNVNKGEAFLRTCDNQMVKTEKEQLLGKFKEESVKIRKETSKMALLRVGIKKRQGEYAMGVEKHALALKHWDRQRNRSKQKHKANPVELVLAHVLILSCTMTLIFLQVGPTNGGTLAHRVQAIQNSATISFLQHPTPSLFHDTLRQLGLPFILRWKTSPKTSCGMVVYA